MKGVQAVRKNREHIATLLAHRMRAKHSKTDSERVWETIAVGAEEDLESGMGPREIGKALMDRAGRRYETLQYRSAVNDYFATHAARGTRPSRRVTFEDVLGYAAVRVGERGMSSAAFKKVFTQLKKGLIQQGFEWSDELDERKNDLFTIIGHAWPAPEERRAVPVDAERLEHALDAQTKTRLQENEQNPNTPARSATGFHAGKVLTARNGSGSA
jgi:hypothetical protein